MDHPELRDDEKSIWDKPGTRRLIWVFLIGGAALSAAAGVVAQVMHKLHPHFAVDAFPVFYGVFGFVAFAGIVLVGQHLRLLLMRPENYYKDDPDAPVRPEEKG